MTDEFTAYIVLNEEGFPSALEGGQILVCETLAGALRLGALATEVIARCRIEIHPDDRYSVDAFQNLARKRASGDCEI